MCPNDENLNPTLAINDKCGKPLYIEIEINKRREDYFKELLDPTGSKKQNSFLKHQILTKTIS